MQIQRTFTVTSIFILIQILSFSFSYAQAQKAMETISGGIMESKNLRELRKNDTYFAINSKSTSTKIYIFTYHNVRDFNPKESFFSKYFVTTPDTLEAELKYLKENDFQTITMHHLSEFISGATTTIPSKPVILTFDDGNRNNFDNAFPLLQKYNQIGTFFIYTKAVNNYPGSMTWDMITALKNAGMEIGGHTLNHPKLTKITDDKVLAREILSNKDILQTKLNTVINAFAYPYGLYNENVIQKVIDAGYKIAATDERGTLQNKDSLFKIRRLNANSNLQEFYYILQKM